MTPVETYQQSLYDFAAAQHSLGQLVKSVRDMSRVFDGWEAANPGEVNGTIRKAVQDWPQGADLVVAVEEWKKAWALMLAKWEEVPVNRRLGLKEPGDIKWE